MSTGWGTVYEGHDISLFTYSQLEGLSCSVLKSRLVQLQEILEGSYEIPPRIANGSEELIRGILCLQAYILCEVEGIEANVLEVARKRFLAPSHYITAEQNRPTTPPRRRNEKVLPDRGAVSQRSPSVEQVAVGKADQSSLITEPASLYVATIRGKKLPLYHYDQLQHLGASSLLSRARLIEEVVGCIVGDVELPKPTSRRAVDLIIYLLRVQAELVAFKSKKDVREVLENVFGAPQEWSNAVADCPKLKGTIHLQRKHFADTFLDHIEFSDGGFQPSRGFEKERASGDYYFAAQVDHLRGDSFGHASRDVSMKGDLPRCIGHGKRHIEPTNRDEVEPRDEHSLGWAVFKDDVEMPRDAHRHDFTPQDHMRGGFAEVCNDSEVNRGMRHVGSFLGGNERRGGRILLSGHD